MNILTQAHRDHFDENGYMVVEGAVPTALCDAVVAAIFAFLEMDSADPETWYRAPHKPGAGCRHGRNVSASGAGEKAARAGSLVVDHKWPVSTS